MTKLSKPDLLKKVGDYVLVHGLNTASLRPLARAAGTSDRMLIYHFGSKEALIGAVLEHLATEFSVLLEGKLLLTGHDDARSMLREIVRTLRREPFLSYIRIWLEIVSASSQGHAAHRQTGYAVAQFFVEWLAARVPASEVDPRITAQLMLTLLEGAHALDAVGQAQVADQAIEAAFS